MKLSDAYRKMIIDEIKFAVKKMIESEDAFEKLYYFSAIFGVLHRIYNIEYNSDLVFAHFVLRATHDSFLNRLKAIQQQGERAVLISDEQFDKLHVLSNEFAQKLKNKKDFVDTLKKFTVLLYSTTGNGFYLMQKGVLKI